MEFVLSSKWSSSGTTLSISGPTKTTIQTIILSPVSTLMMAKLTESMLSRPSLEWSSRLLVLQCSSLTWDCFQDSQELATSFSTCTLLFLFSSRFHFCTTWLWSKRTLSKRSEEGRKAGSKRITLMHWKTAHWTANGTGESKQNQTIHINSNT